MFTKRVVGEKTRRRGHPQGARGRRRRGLGLGNAYLWRGLPGGDHYNDEAANEPPSRPLARSSCRRWSSRWATSCRRDGGPGPVALLPKDGMVPRGVRYVTKDVLGVEGVGGGAFGYYKEGDDRWRVASIARADAEQAKDVLASFAKATGATKEKNVGEGAVRLTIKESEGVPTEWVFARAGKNVIGIGDEPRVLRRG